MDFNKLEKDLETESHTISKHKNAPFLLNKSKSSASRLIKYSVSE